MAHSEIYNLQSAIYGGGSFDQEDRHHGWPREHLAGRALDQELDKHAIDHDIKIYPGAKHSFFNDQRGNYDAAAATDSWRGVLAFFEEHIRIGDRG